MGSAACNIFGSYLKIEFTVCNRITQTGELLFIWKLFRPTDMTTMGVKNHFPVKKSSSSVTKDASKQPNPKEKAELDRLIQFDLNWEYGPCTGITRLERWERAESFGRKPPRDVKDLILQHSQDTKYTDNCWSSQQI